MTRRRDLLLAAGVILLSPFTVVAQQQPTIRRIGFVAAIPPAAAKDVLAAFREGLREFGFVEGRNLAIEYRWPKGSFEQDPHFVSSLVTDKVDVIVAWATPPGIAAQKATSTIPIVLVGVADPVATGLVRSLAHPGENITGVTNFSDEMTAKQVHLLMELLPGLRRVGIIRNPRNPAATLLLNEAERAFRALGLQSQVIDARLPEEFEKAFERLNADAIKAVILLADPSLVGHRAAIADFALRAGLATMFQREENVEAGGLMSYGPYLADQLRQAARYVDRILKGAKPADMPVEGPTKISLVINATTAKALGLTIPRSILLRADRVIE